MLRRKNIKLNAAIAAVLISIFSSQPVIAAPNGASPSNDAMIISNNKVCMFGVAYSHPSTQHIGYHVYNVENVVSIEIYRKEPTQLVVSLNGRPDAAVYQFSSPIIAYRNLQVILSSMKSCTVMLPEQLDTSVPSVAPRFLDNVSQIPTENSKPSANVQPQGPPQKKKVY
ncbi:MAG: hypothetical protein RSN61_21260 [Chryseobacterium sp.]|uniref:hypothetical protein n=1 Tax=Chryseobacterium sp. TaxID=1871047 RepID=UPI002FC8A2E5